MSDMGDTHQIPYQTYYYEKSDGSGAFNAQSNEEALKLMPLDTIYLYTESDTRNGLPFRTVYNKEKVKK